MPRVQQPTRQLKVIATALNVRRSPSLQAAIIGSISQSDIVDWLDSSDDDNWYKIQKGDVTGWSSQRFLVPVQPPVSAGPLDEIIQLAAGSAIAGYDWVGRGVAPRGYIKGMALVYARVYCKLKSGDSAAIEMAKANTGNRDRDALAWYAARFDAVNMSNETSGALTLRHLFVLLIGLGMRESSGRYCEGRDRSANNTGANTAEAGLFQMSYDARSASPPLAATFSRILSQAIVRICRCF
jgi:Bacterial SH3 domain